MRKGCYMKHYIMEGIKKGDYCIVKDKKNSIYKTFLGRKFIALKPLKFYSVLNTSLTHIWISCERISGKCIRIDRKHKILESLVFITKEDHDEIVTTQFFEDVLE